ncbi:MAG TPA: type VI secretion system baseplate subunit TssE [Pyrinomonadaceae bacterium]|nr:type VI secretion system baseplate subunit TssE [Pyrinomonadaceae bacterium]
MRDPKPIEGGRALLFERLSDAEPRSRTEEAQPFRVHDVRALRESVRRELARLLNTRRHPRAESGGDGLTVLDYGIPDFSPLSASSGDDQNRLASEVAAAVAAFEPRLSGVRVRVERPHGEGRALLLRIEGRLAVGTLAEPVSFPVLVRVKSGEALVDEDEPA